MHRNIQINDIIITLHVFWVGLEKYKLTHTLEQT